MDENDKLIVNGLLSKITDCLLQLPNYGIYAGIRPIWIDGKKGIWFEIDNVVYENGVIKYDEGDE